MVCGITCGSEQAPLKRYYYDIYHIIVCFVENTRMYYDSVFALQMHLRAAMFAWVHVRGTSKWNRGDRGELAPHAFLLT